jgi:pSer/pThr/pTyr-binding forkhead associated (FHA) protein
MNPGKATLIPVTVEAAAALGGKTEVPLTRFPFKFGRESRLSREAVSTEQRLGRVADVNDFYLKEPATAEMLQISRDHFSIERAGDEFFVVDRGSVAGTIVGGRRIGGHRQGGRTPLKAGDEIVVGGSSSRYVFRFAVQEP